MASINSENSLPLGKIGFHYFQDTVHYTTKDQETWIPQLTRLSASWVILRSDTTRAIPEQFISALLDAKITPIVHFPLRLPDASSAAELRPLLEVYSRWGVKYVLFFEKPNDSSQWSGAGWNTQNLVERFIDRFLPLALEADKLNLTVILPPLLPGGNYWDTSFFKSALQSLQRRGHKSLVERMVISAYAWTYGHELSWGEGGSEKWPKSKPYNTPEDSQDQLGFNNYAWLSTIAKSLGFKNLQVLLLGAGVKKANDFYTAEMQYGIVKNILDKLNKTSADPGTVKILGCNFWLLAADNESADYPQSWVRTDGSDLPVTNLLKNSTAAKYSSFKYEFRNEPKETVEPEQQAAEIHDQQIEHYLLLPTFEWGISDWYLDVARPFIRKYKPTIGFSLKEASLAKKVTVVGGAGSYSQQAISELRTSGCIVDEITGDGTSIATQLIER